MKTTPVQLARFFSEAEAVCRALVETATDAIVVFDQEYRIIFLNSAAAGMFGYPTDDPGLSFDSLTDKESWTRIRTCIDGEPVLRCGDRCGEPVSAILCRRKNGNSFPAELSLSRHEVAGKRVYTCIIRDSTERRKAEENVLRLSTFPERNPNPIVEIDTQGRIRYLNPAAAQLFPSLCDDTHIHPFVGDPRWFGNDVPGNPEQPVTREIQAGDRFYHQSIHYLPDTGRFRIYGTDITECKKAEEALKESGERLRLAQEAGNVGVWELDLLTNEVRWTRELETMYGQKSRKIRTYQDFLALVHPEDIAIVAAGRDRAVEQRKRFESEFRIRRPDGDTRWIYCRGGAIYDEAGKPLRILGVNIDITEHKRVEEALRESEKRFRALITASSQVLYSMSPDWSVMRQLKGGSFLADTNAPDPGWMQEYILPDDQNRVRTIIDTAVRNGETFDMEHRVMLADGTIGWTHSRAVPLRNAAGEIMEWFGSAEDITGRRRAEQILKRQAALIDLSPDAVLVRRIDDTISFWSRGAEKLYGWTKEEAVGQHSHTLLCTVFPQPLEEIGEQLLREGRWKGELVHRCRDGREVIVQSRWMVQKGEGDVQEVLESNVDITERKNAEEELKRKHDDLSLREQELMDSLAEKEVLLSEIHHRVKNNLSAFISLLSLEGSTEDTPEGRELKKDLQNRALSMALIHETLYRTQKFSDVDMDAYLTPLVNQVVNSYSSPKSIRTIVEAKGVKLDLSRATPAGLIVNELVTNSLKHGFPVEAVSCRDDRTEPCTIRIRLAEKDGSYVMSVSDNGAGLPQGFDPLTAKTLGLKLVNFLARHQMSAEIEVNTTKGTEFIFRF